VPDEDKLVSLAHEVGHFLNRIKHEFWSLYSGDAIDLLNQNPNTQIIFDIEDPGLDENKKISAHELILEEEKLAWNTAEEIFKNLNIKKPKRFDEMKRKGLKSYKDALKKSLSFKRKITIKDKLDT
jgi:hypothetical protein